MKEDNVDLVVEAIGSDAAIRIPETGLHWIIICHLLAEGNHFAPGHPAMLGTCYIENRNSGRTIAEDSTIQVTNNVNEYD